MRALILAAGVSSRLNPRTLRMPKCLLEVGGKAIIHHQLALLRGSGIEDITVATGFQADVLRSAVGDAVSYRHSPKYATTNNLCTLHSCRDLLSGELVILFSDVLVTPDAFARCVSSAHDYALLTDTAVCLAGTMRVRRNGHQIIDLGTHIPVEDGHGTFVGIARFSAKAATRLGAELDCMMAQGDCSRELYTRAVARLAAAGEAVQAIPVAGEPWIEIDTEDDYRRALAHADRLCP
jgi:choline kinase